MFSSSLRPLIDTCQKCSTSPANHEPRSPANGSFQNPGVCPQAVPSFPSPTPTVLFLALAPFSAQAKYRKPRSSVFLCSQTLRKRLLRRLRKVWKSGQIRTNVRIYPDFHTFLCKFSTFLNACISVQTSPINTKLGDFVNLGVLFLTMWINSC